MTQANSESALIVAKLAYDTVRLRIETGDDPDDAMMHGWQIMEAWVHVEVDGGWPKFFASKSATAETVGLRSDHTEPCPMRGLPGHTDTCTVSTAYHRT